MVNLGCCDVPMACLFRFGGLNANGIFKLLCQLTVVWHFWVFVASLRQQVFSVGVRGFP